MIFQRNKIKKLLSESEKENKYKDFWDAMWSGHSIQYRNVLEHYVPQLRFMKGLDQNPEHHPEGDVDVHVYAVVDAVAQYHDKDISMSALFHDLGKIDTREYNEKNGYSTYNNHEFVSSEYVRYYKDFIEDAGANYHMVYDLVSEHMRFHKMEEMRTSKKNKLLAKSNYDKLKKLCDADDYTRRKT